MPEAFHSRRLQSLLNRGSDGPHQGRGLRPGAAITVTANLASSEEALDQFLDDFEQARIPFSDWTHAAHITMACCYIRKLPKADLLSTVRRNIKNYNVRGGGKNTDTSGYHETLTVLWLWVLADYLESFPAQTPRLEQVRKAVEEFSGNRLYPEYYSYDVVKSVEARRIWMEPDVKQLPDNGSPLEE